MALNAKTAVASRNLGLNAAWDVANGGTLVILDGTQPADADTAITTQNVLATLALSATAFAAATAGSKTANAITGANATRTGTASWFRIYRSDGTTAVGDGSVGTATANLVLNSTAIVSGAPVSVSSLVVSQAA